MILKHKQTLSDLREIHASTGKLIWIGFRPAHRQAMVIPRTAMLLENKGIEGDHMALRSSKKRQITLIQAEHLPVISKLANRKTVTPESLRRNLMIDGINVLSLKGEKFSIGNCILEGTTDCHPCSRMEETLGTGGYNAMRGHGGITAVIHKGGQISLGDEIRLISSSNKD